LASARSPWAACNPLPRSTSEKHLDFATYTLMSASGDSRLYRSHHRSSGSVTARVPYFLSQLGISGCGASALAAAAAHITTTVSVADAAFFASWCNTYEPSRRQIVLAQDPPWHGSVSPNIPAVASATGGGPCKSRQPWACARRPPAASRAVHR